MKTAAYSNNRLISQGEDEAPITRWRKGLGIGNRFPPLDHLRLFCKPVYVHIHKEDRSSRIQGTFGRVRGR
jgi:hypothetical protein